MSQLNDVLLDGSIPGESLTHEFGTMPYDQLPEIEDPVEALDYHLDRMQEPKIRKAMADAIELGIPIKDLNLGMLRSAVYQSKHDMDAMFTIASVTHEALELLAEEEGIDDYLTGFEPTEEDMEKEYTIESMKAQKLLRKHAKTGDLKGITEDDLQSAKPEVSGILVASMESDPMAIEEDMPEQEMTPPKGLMARGT